MINTLVQNKWVRVMTDYCADPVWDKDGCNAPIEDLPVSDDLRSRLSVWEDWFDLRHSDSPIPNYEEFVDTGFRLAAEVKRQLPEWTVIYHDPRLYGVASTADTEITAETAATTPPSLSEPEIRKLSEE